MRLLLMIFLTAVAGIIFLWAAMPGPVATAANDNPDVQVISPSTQPAPPATAQNAPAGAPPEDSLHKAERATTRALTTAEKATTKALEIAEEATTKAVVIAAKATTKAVVIAGKATTEAASEVGKAIKGENKNSSYDAGKTESATQSSNY